MPLFNPWVSYIDRSYQQIKTSLLTKFQNQIPEMTDDTENNIFVRMLGIWAGISEQLNYYLDNKAREVYITVAKRFSSAVKIGRLFDYRVKGTNAASVDLTFYFDNPVTADVDIPAGTEVKTKEGTSFITVEDVTIANGSSQITVGARQWKQTSAVLGDSSGAIDQVFLLEPNVVQGSIAVTVGVNSYLPVDTLAFSNSTDKNFVSGVNEDGKMTIQFGDDINGVIPPVGQSVAVTYYVSGGSIGNVAPNKITELISSITVPTGFTLKVTNGGNANGGVDQETLAYIRKRVPYSLRTLYKAVTKQDYIDIAEMVTGVGKADVSFNCGKTVDVYIAPIGGGMASSLLIADTLDYFEDKRMVTTKVRILAAGEIPVTLEIDVKLLPGTDTVTAVNAIKAALVAFGSVENQDIEGGMQIGDIYQTVEDSKGVKYSDVKKMSIIPFGSTVGETVTPLIWTRAIQPLSMSTIKWTIKMNNSSAFQLFKDSVYLGTFNVGTPYTFDEIIFNVTANGYVASDSWTFFTYPYFGSFQLEEFSIPTINAGDVTINASGGI